eukprot:14111688-Alexandrium_andersonii.AAC.1
MCDKPDLFSPHWRPQEGATVATEDGDVPEDWADYIQSLKRANRWVDGLMLLAAAEHCSRHIVVLQADGG